MKKVFSFELMVFIATIIILFSFKVGLCDMDTNSWKGIIPGKSDLSDVISKLGKPYREDRSDMPKDHKLNLFYEVEKAEEKKIITSNIIVLKNNIVLSVSISDTDYFATNPDEIEKILGKPEKKIHSNFSEFSWYSLYPSKGIAYLVDGNEVVKKIIFLPTSLEEFEKKYKWY